MESVRVFSFMPFGKIDYLLSKTQEGREDGYKRKYIINLRQKWQAWQTGRFGVLLNQKNYLWWQVHNKGQRFCEPDKEYDRFICWIANKALGDGKYSLISNLMYWYSFTHSFQRHLQKNKVDHTLYFFCFARKRNEKKKSNKRGGWGNSPIPSIVFWQ